MTLVWMVPVTGAAAVLFALWLAYDVLRRDTGTAAMQEIAGMIFEGAMAFLSRQYRTIAILAVADGGGGRRARRQRSRKASSPSSSPTVRSASARTK